MNGKLRRTSRTAAVLLLLPSLFVVAAQAPGAAQTAQRLATTGEGGLLVTDTALRDPRVLFSSFASGLGPRTLDWSPNGTKIAFQASHAPRHTSYQETDLLLMDADGTNVVNLTGRYNDETEITHESFPTWSPDGREIAFIRTVEDCCWSLSSEIAIVNVDGTGFRTVAVEWPDGYHDSGEPRGLRWSPDGTRFAYSQWHEVDPWNDEFIGGIWIVPSTGGTPHLEIEDADDPAWSPDGTQMAFDHGQGLSVRELSSGAERRLVSDLSNYSAESPDWSPDGSKIAYVYENQVFTVTSDGSQVAPVEGLTNHAWVAWQPCAGSCPGAGQRTPSWVKPEVLVRRFDYYLRVDAVPNLAGKDVTITVLQKRSGSWKRAFRYRAALTRTSEWSSETEVFPLNARWPTRRACKVKVAFAGTDRYLPSRYSFRATCNDPY